MKVVSQMAEDGNGFSSSCEFENPICGTTLSCYFETLIIFFWKHLRSPSFRLEGSQFSAAITSKVTEAFHMQLYNSVSRAQKIVSPEWKKPTMELVFVSTSWVALNVLFSLFIPFSGMAASCHLHRSAQYSNVGFLKGDDSASVWLGFSFISGV